MLDFTPGNYIYCEHYTSITNSIIDSIINFIAGFFARIVPQTGNAYDPAHSNKVACSAMAAHEDTVVAMLAVNNIPKALFGGCSMRRSSVCSPSVRQVRDARR